MEKMNLTINHKDGFQNKPNGEIDIVKRMDVLSDIITVDVHTGEGFESGQTPETHRYLFELALVEPFYNFDEVFERIHDMSQNHDKYKKGLEVYIDGELFAKKEENAIAPIYNKEFSRNLIQQYSCKPEVILETTKNDNGFSINQIMEVANQRIRVQFNNASKDEIKDFILKQAKGITDYLVIDDYSFSLDGEKICVIQDGQLKKTRERKLKTNNRRNP